MQKTVWYKYFARTFSINLTHLSINKCKALRSNAKYLYHIFPSVWVSFLEEYPKVSLNLLSADRFNLTIVLGLCFPKFCLSYATRWSPWLVKFWIQIENTYSDFHESPSNCKTILCCYFWWYLLVFLSQSSSWLLRAFESSPKACAFRRAFEVKQDRRLSSNLINIAN